VKKLKTLKIDRSYWNRGSIVFSRRFGLQSMSVIRYLEDPDTGAMCCLGFLAKASQSMDKNERCLVTQPDTKTQTLYNVSNKDVVCWERFVAVNDKRIHINKREDLLKDLFKERLGIKLTFKGETPNEKT